MAAEGARLAFVVLLLAAAAAPAQPVPDKQQIIDALTPAPTRSLRNLVARSKAADTAASVPATASIDLSIQFDFDSASIRGESREVLLNLAAALKSPALRDSRFLVEGHTDSVGPDGHNLRLSVERAEQVRLFLLASGVTGSRVETAGRGATQPLNVGDPTAAENRRVRIVNLQ